MRFFPAFGVLALIIQCCSLPMDILSGLSWPDDNLLADALTRVKKDADSIDYLEECTFVNSWQEQPGFINVLAFLDASWEYSHRQATMLKLLQGRLEKSGIKGIKFFVINSSEPEAAVDNLDVKDEKEAWDAAEPEQTQTFSKIQQTREALKSKIDPDITFIQDTDELKIWEKLSASRDQVIVIDRCGRLSYRVIVPWSILHFPYVKAAILSTYKEQPCGRCDIETTTAAQETEAQTEPLSELLPENLSIKQIQEIAVKTYNLDETDNTVKQIYHSSKSQDIPENVIQLLNKSASVKKDKVHLDFNNSTEHALLLSTGDLNSDDSYMNGYTQAANSPEDSVVDNKYEDLSVTENTLSVEERMTAQLDGDSSSTIANSGVETTTINIIEDESYDSTEKTNHLGNDYEADDREFMEWSSLENTTEYHEVETSTPGSSDFIDASSDSEGTSTSSSSEGSDNRINKTVIASGETISSENSEDTDYVMPIRIIMHAPHIHEFEEPMKKYEYLVLKLGKPEYHGHLDNDDASNDDEAGFESSYEIGSEVNDEEIHESELESGVVGSGENEKRLRHHGNGHGHKGRHKQSKGKHLHSIFDKDESPGFYGEDVEYWRNSGNGDYQGTPQIEQPSENMDYRKDNDKQMEAVNVGEAIQNDTAIITSSKNGTITGEGEPRYLNSNENQEPFEEIDERKDLTVDEQVEDSTKEDEKANQLFVHYSKLIPWLDYVFEQ